MKTIRVTGQGAATAPVDHVELRFDVAAQEMDYEESVNALSEQVAQLRSDVGSAGAPVDEMKTSSFSVDAQSHWDSETSQSLFYGYRASHRLTLGIDWDQDLLNSLLRQIAAGGSCADLDIVFTVKDDEGLKREALADAVRSAQEQAEILAEAAGVCLGALQSIDHTWSEVHFSRSEVAYSMQEAAGAPMADVDPEDIGTSDTATLVWEIRTESVCA